MTDSTRPPPLPPHALPQGPRPPALPPSPATPVAKPPRPAQRIMAVLAAGALILTIAAELPDAFTRGFEWITARNVAWNAAVKEHGEAVVLAETAAKELEVARNAGERQKAEADQIAADADKIAAEARTARAKADNAIRRARADADKITAEAAINRQKAMTELQKARVAAIEKRTEAEKAEQGVKASRLALRGTVYTLYMINCPGLTYIAKIDAAEQGRCALRYLR